METIKIGKAFDSLDPLAKHLVYDDVMGLIAEDDSRSVDDAIKVLRYRIGGWENLPSYAACLVAGYRRRENIKA